jgi:hypothetical protein
VPVLRDGWSVVRMPTEERFLSLLQNVQSSCGSKRSSVQWLLGVYLGVRRPGDDVEHSRPSIIEFRNDWSYNFFPPFVFMAWRGTNLTSFYAKSKNYGNRQLVELVVDG